MNTNIKISKSFLLKAGTFLSSAALLGAPLFAHATVINRQLELGMSGSDVSAMQTFFATDPTIYPQGLVTGYFGFLTKSAVSNFQSKNGISSVGRVGPQTLPILNYQMEHGMNGGADVAAPTISSVGVSKTNTTALVSWNTNDFARGKLFYSTSPIIMNNTFEATGVNFVEPSVMNGTLAQYDAVPRTAHAVSITGLLPNTTYYYLIEVLDQSNNVSVTLPASFHTSN